MDTIEEIHDCFLGGGSLPIYLTKLYPNKKIIVNDVYEPLYNFWIQLRDNGEKLSEEILKIKKIIILLNWQNLYLIYKKKNLNQIIIV